MRPPYQALSFDICEALARLANPANSSALTPALYRQACAALGNARTEALARAAGLPRIAAQDCIAFAEALDAAMALLESLQAAA